MSAGLGSLSWPQRNRALRVLRECARKSGVSMARAEMRTAWAALIGRAATGGPRGNWSSAPLVLASETVANMVIEQLGPRWGLSRSTADEALGELADDWIAEWDTCPPVIEVNDNGTSKCVGREVRRVRLHPAMIEHLREALGLLNPEISGVPDSPPARDAALSGGERRAPLENAVPDRPPPNETPPEKSPADVFREIRERIEGLDRSKSVEPRPHAIAPPPGGELPPDAIDRANGKRRRGK